MDCDEARQHGATTSPSTQTILCVLAKTGPLTMKDLAAASGLARRTVYGAVRRLAEIGVVQGRPDLRDTRQTLFWFTG